MLTFCFVTLHYCRRVKPFSSQSASFPLIPVVDLNGCEMKQFEVLHGMIRPSPNGLAHTRSVEHVTEVYSSSPTIQNCTSCLLPTCLHYVRKVYLAFTESQFRISLSACLCIFSCCHDHLSFMSFLHCCLISDNSNHCHTLVIGRGLGCL